jgi:hypothetical protein
LKIEKMSQLLLSTAYLPPIAYFCNIISTDNIIIEHFETYPKQTYRNRCEIYSANGKHSLTIPVIKTNGNHTLTKDIELSYSTNWQKTHWRAIESAYNNSPFYLYFSDLFKPFYETKYKYLIDFNLQLLEVILSILKIDINIDFSLKYEKQPAQSIDLRDAIHPKKISMLKFNDSHSYTQVFQNKFGFISNLSIIDLLFNEGNFSKEYLLKNK